MNTLQIIFQINSAWQFGSTELIALLSTLATFSAVIVSLLLAFKAKAIKYKVVINHKMAGLQIVNTGNVKFLVNAFGIYTNGTHYLNPHERFCKVLVHSKQTSQHSFTFQECSLGYVVLEPGDVVEIALQHFDYSLLTGKTYLFVSVSGKIKKYQLDINDIDINMVPQMEHYCKCTKREIKNLGFYLREH